MRTADGIEAMTLLYDCPCLEVTLPGCCSEISNASRCAEHEWCEDAMFGYAFLGCAAHRIVVILVMAGLTVNVKSHPKYDPVLP